MSDLTSKFVSQSELEEKRKKRQEEWEKVRRPEQPKEAPEEEEIDRRSLFERLQEQKDKKQAEYEDQHKLKNQVRGLDNEEADFLEFVSQRQQELEAERLREEEETLALLRAPSEKAAVATIKPAVGEKSSDAKPSVHLGPKKQTQADILSRLVKRKRSDAEGTNEETKRARGDSPEKGEATLCSKDDRQPTEAEKDDVGASPRDGNGSTAPESVAGAQTIGILPGIGSYSDSSNSDSSSSDSEIDTDMFRRSSKDVEKIIQTAAAYQH